MKTGIRTKVNVALVGLAVLTTAAPSWAGQSIVPPITIFYEPLGAQGATSVPTLSEWGMIAMVMLVAVVAFRSLRGRLGARTLKSVVLAGLLGLAAMHSESWFTSVTAAPVDTNLDNPAGGSKGVTGLFSGQNGPVTNTTSVALKITAVTPSPGVTLETPTVVGGTQCQPMLMLAVGGTCYVRYVYDED